MDAVQVGQVASLYRYPVRSMGGESLEETRIETFGVVGDRAFGVIEPDAFEMIGAARNPRLNGRLVRWQARYAEEPRADAPLPALAVIDEDGQPVEGDLAACGRRLSELFGRPLELWQGDARGALSMTARADEAGGEPVPKLPYPAAPVHLVTTASQAEGLRLHPDGDFDPARFRPNVLVDTGDHTGFLEAGWVGKRVRIGDTVTLGVFQECVRCVETTLPQGTLPSDPAILKTVTQHNNQNFGVYLGVAEPGLVRVGDPVFLLDD